MHSEELFVLEKIYAARADEAAVIAEAQERGGLSPEIADRLNVRWEQARMLAEIAGQLAKLNEGK